MDDNEFMRKAFERIAARQRDHDAFLEKFGELVQNVAAAGMPEEALRTAFERGMQRGTYLRDNHRSGGEVVDIKQ
jgi:ferric-dicitrate binding protein FerR (iron transport regulator)